MNFKLLLVILIPIALLLIGYKLLTRLDRSDPVAVGTAFTKALKSRDTGAASKLWIPDKAEAWRADADKFLGRMKSGATETYFERIPSAPGFTAPADPKASAATLRSSDTTFSIDLTQMDGKWYVSKAPL
jgi:hypothetical protein